MKGRRDTPDEEGSYGGAHLTWYTRLRCRSQPPYGLLGLIRVDVHRATFGIKLIDAVNSANFGEYRSLVDAITQAVWRERWPVFGRVNDYHAAAEPYPIWQVEQALKAMVLPRRFLSHLLAETRTQ